MERCDTLICNARLIDGSGSGEQIQDVAVAGDRILKIGPSLRFTSGSRVDGQGLTLTPGFIDVHTHDDLAVLKSPAMLPKLSQGITTVITGNCGISAAPVLLRGELPDPMNRLGSENAFIYETFDDYVRAVAEAKPAVNVGALVGHTALRNNHLDRLDRCASNQEVAAMRLQLAEALEAGALGLSTGLAYMSANAASTDEVLALTEVLHAMGGIYTSHMRTEADHILEAMDEAFQIGKACSVPVILSHLKCAGIDNWGRSAEVLRSFDTARAEHQVGCDCYPYAAGSSTLDLRQVDERVLITITWSDTHPEMAGRSLADIADEWSMPQIDAARTLQPAGAIYHSVSEEDMQRILKHPATMIGSDGLPNDPRPHPRLWGTFPRVLGRYCRDLKLFTLPEAVHKMTAMPAMRFGLPQRGLIREGYHADLVLLNAATIADVATYAEPEKSSIGIEGVWVNGTLSYASRGATGFRAGRFLSRGSTDWVQ